MTDQQKRINCRVCLRYDSDISLKCLSLFEKYNNSLIAEKIKYVTNIEIKESDGLPGKICPECLLQLETALIFKQKCETSQQILLGTIKQSPKACKVSFRVPVKKEIDAVFDNKPDNLKTALGISKVEVLDDKDEITFNELNTTCRKSKLENVIPKYEELDYGISDNEDYLIETLEHEEMEDKTVVTSFSAENECTTEVRKSRAIDLKLICDDCGGSFKSKCKIAVHWKKVHLASKLMCPQCKRMFKSYKAYHLHKKHQSKSCLIATKVRIEGHGKSRIFHCNDCNYQSKRIKDIGAHLTTHNGDRPFQCKDCSRCFTQHSSLQGHREAHHKDYKVVATCHYCGKLIKGRNKLYKHLKQHQPAGAQCEVCKKTLKNQQSLLNHMKRHSGIRSYTCEICSANFYTLSELCNHRKKVHMKEKKFKCDMCDYASFTRTLLQKHRSRHTQNNVVCLICGKFVENAEKLLIHRRKHNEKNYMCPNCEKGFYRRDSLNKHIMKKHRPKKETEKVKSMNVKQECTVEVELIPILS